MIEQRRNAVPVSARDALNEAMVSAQAWLTGGLSEDAVATGVMAQLLATARALKEQAAAPVPLILTCPCCKTRHIDRGHFATHPHHTHACQRCGTVWRPAIVPTVGVHFLPGFKDEDPDV